MSVLPGYKTRSEAVAQYLRDEILGGALPAGSRLRQNDVAERFGVSTTPVREAFAVLVQEGLLSLDAHKGVTVMQPSIEDIRENYEMRIVLECLAAERAAQKVTGADLAELDALLVQMNTASGKSPVDKEYVALNAMFHARIYAIAERPRLAELIESLREQASIYISLFAHTITNPEISQDQHKAILDALREQDPAQAATAMREHLQCNADFIVGQIEAAQSKPKRAA